MISVVNYGAGNVNSIVNMLKRIGVPATIINTPDDIVHAERIILPGVGAFDASMHKLQENDLLPALHHAALEKKTPILGICLGMQLLANHSEEGNCQGLQWIPAEITHFSIPEEKKLPVPHMGWNKVECDSTHPLFTDMDEAFFYFVHSYHYASIAPEHVIATTNYGYNFPCVVGNDNILGVQFHPEKSHKYGMQLLKNFTEFTQHA